MKQLLLLLIVASTFHINAQRVVRMSINSAGNIEKHQQITLSQTIGQSANFSVFTQNNLQLRQGFQQVDSKSQISNNKELNFVVFPNPNKGSFTIRFSQRTSEQMHFRIFDNLGKIIREELKLVNGQEKNYTIALPSGMYFLQIENSERASGIQKIIIIH